MTEVWDRIWRNEVAEWDPLSEEIYQVLKKEIGDFGGKKILDAGAGSGRISLKLALEGADVTLLDYSEKALERCKELFDRHNQKATLIKSDLRKDLPFEDDSFDIVWNSGVMEHFVENEQVFMVSEFARIAREFHTFCPNARSFLYQIGKWVAERAGIWPYGCEYPVETMKIVFNQAGYTLEKEYPIAHLISVDFLVFINGGENLHKAILSYLQSLVPEKAIDTLERLGGYLLYSKGVRESVHTSAIKRVDNFFTDPWRF